MTKYELCRLENHSLKQEIESLKERNAQLKAAVNRLQPIVDKCFLNSPDYRKRFLTVGSEWECVADYMCALLVDSFTQGVRYLNKGNVVKVIDINEKYHTVFIRSVIHTYSVTLDQFLLCNKPKEPPK